METADVLRYSVSANTWTSLAPMPVATAGSAAALGADGKIYVVGGVSGGVTTNAVQVYDPAANSWTLSTPLPESLTGSVMGTDSLGRLVVMGGSDTNGYDTGDVWRSQQLGAPDSPPVFTPLPATNNATYQSALRFLHQRHRQSAAGLFARQRARRHDGGLFQRRDKLDAAGALIKSEPFR